MLWRSALAIGSAASCNNYSWLRGKQLSDCNFKSAVHRFYRGVVFALRAKSLISLVGIMAYIADLMCIVLFLFRII